MDLRIDRIRLGVTSCYLVRHEGTILIDTGHANQGKKFEENLSRLGVKPEEVKLILITHGHFDHIGLWRFTKPTGRGSKRAFWLRRMALRHGEASWPDCCG